MGKRITIKSSFIEHFCSVALRNAEGMQKITDLVFLPWGATFNRHWWTYKPSYNAVSSVQSLSRVWLFATPWTAAHQASLSITNSQSIPKLRSIESVMPSNHLILCCPFLLLPSIFLSIKVFSNESVLRIRWPKYWSFSFSICPSNKYSGLISFRTDLLDHKWQWNVLSAKACDQGIKIPHST